MTITVTDNGIKKTISEEVHKILKRTEFPQFVEPYNSMIKQVYKEEITKEEFLAEFMKEFLNE